MPNAFLALPNQRFTFDPANGGTLHLTAHRIGGASIDVGDHKQDYNIGTKGRGTNFNNCIVGYVSGKAENYQNGTIHFLGMANATSTERAHAYQAVAQFVKLGAVQDTALLAYGTDHRAETTLGAACAPLFA